MAEPIKLRLVRFMRWMQTVPIGGDVDSWTREEQERIAEAYLYDCPACVQEREKALGGPQKCIGLFHYCDKG